MGHSRENQERPLVEGCLCVGIGGGLYGGIAGPFPDLNRNVLVLSDDVEDLVLHKIAEPTLARRSA